MKHSVGKMTAALLLVVVLTVSLVQPVSADAEAEADWSSRYEKESSKAPTGNGTAVPPSYPSGPLGGFPTSSKYSFDSVKKAIAEHQAINPDVKGWLIVPGTNINEPIVHSDKGNKYYLNRDWKGVDYPNNNWQNFVTTATYADLRTRWPAKGQGWNRTSKNTVLYGHNWTNLRTPLDIGANSRHTMFAQLPSYTSLDFAKNNPYIYYSVGENEGIWKVFSVAYLENNTWYNTANPTTEQYKQILGEFKSRSIFDFDVGVTTNDCILTLSTCTRIYANMGEDQTFVVVARLMREDESETDPIAVTVNKDVKNPQF